MIPHHFYMDILNYPCPTSGDGLAHFSLKIRSRQESNQLTITTYSVKYACRLFIRFFVVFVSPVLWEFTWSTYLPVPLDVILRALVHSYIVYKYSSGFVIAPVPLNVIWECCKTVKRTEQRPCTYSSRCIVWWTKSRVLCQKQVSRAGTSNNIPQILWAIRVPALDTCLWHNIPQMRFSDFNRR